jgi:hypothetical protein
VKKQLFAISFLASSFAVSMILTGCASGPEPRQAEEQEASTAQAPQAQPPLVQAPQPQAPQAQPAQPLPAQQQAATMANPPNEDDPNYGGDPVLVEVMTRDQWLQNLKEVLSTELCSQDEIFRSCYPVSEGECRQHIQVIRLGFLSNSMSQIDKTGIRKLGNARAAQCRVYLMQSIQ